MLAGVTIVLAILAVALWPSAIEIDVAKVDIVMKVGAVEESVLVSGASPIVDVTSTGTSSRLTTEMLETTPTGRVGFFALLAQAPGVRNSIDIGGSSANANSITFRAFGQSG